VRGPKNPRHRNTAMVPLALFGRPAMCALRSLSGVKQTGPKRAVMSPSDPERTLASIVHRAAIPFQRSCLDPPRWHFHRGSAAIHQR
jgi:hypothetical protein